MVQVDSITPSGDLEFTSPTTGEVSIYNLGDIAWGEYLFIYSLATTDNQSLLPWHSSGS
jgi:hypothetical protein